MTIKRGALRVATVLSVLWLVFLATQLLEWRAHGDPDKAGEVYTMLVIYSVGGIAVMFVSIYVVEWIVRGFRGL